ncbi:MAG: adenylate kinase [Patescibacteria group bacterium]|jgi:adenylate kinase|nr:adenylate kinase [Patescibacteria group bacterium]
MSLAEVKFLTTELLIIFNEMNIVIFGPQGSGKGTQAEFIARRHELPYISTGDIFRYHQKNQTELGQRVVEYLTKGLLVPDELTNEIIKDRINQPDCTVGFVLDGYPRNRQQLDFLNSIAKINFAIVIEIDDNTAVERLGGRLACKCGLSYHLQYNPPKQEGVCNKCGQGLFKRDDDQPEAIKQRLAIYHEQTEPLLEIYEQSGKLHRVDGSKDIEGVYAQIDQIISQHK